MATALEGIGTVRLALGYEGPISVGSFAAAAATVVAAVVFAWLIILFLSRVVSDERSGSDPKSHRRG